MRFPKFLKEGGTIGFMAPSFGCSTQPYKDQFDGAQKIFRQMGFELMLGPNCYADAGIGISNTPRLCAAEVMQMFASDADCLMTCGGGELMCEILPYVDFERLAQMEPKWFMGYSDNTNLTFLLAILADTASVYGPAAPTFGMQPWHASLQDAMDLLMGKKLTMHSYGMWEKRSLKDAQHPYVPYHLTEELLLKGFVGMKPVQEMQFGGRLIGGCLDCLCKLTGTQFDHVKEFAERYQGDGIVWFLEACDLNVFDIRRAMWQLRQAGWFGYTKGFLIGRPQNGEAFMGLDAYEAVLGILGDMELPVIFDVDLGHCAPMMPVILGSVVQVQKQDNTLEIQMSVQEI